MPQASAPAAADPGLDMTEECFSSPRTVGAGGGDSADSPGGRGPRPTAAVTGGGDDEDFRAFSRSAESLAIVGERDGDADSGAKTALTASADADGASAATADSPFSPDGTNPRYVTPKDFELLKVIGMGAFGKVLQVRSRAETGQILAMKVISKRLLKRKTSYVENIQAERDIMKKIRHPFVVDMHASFQTKEKLFIVMDFLAGGELFLRLGREGIFREHTAAFYLAEITLALEHLHNRGVLHRDLKPENILLGSDGHICITDFGLSKDFSAKDDVWARTVCGTQEYMAPEMVARKGYGRAADFWSLGCLAYEMLAGTPPFESRKGSKDLFQKIMNQRVKMPDGASAPACRLLKGLLNRDVVSRLGAAKSTILKVGGVAELKQMEFFAGLDWPKLERKEIDPPEKFDVDNDDDLRHFHEEFTKMTIPRSVADINRAEFRPHHCNSDLFRGFSFVHDDFLLPERQMSEEAEYWRHSDSDGQSLSECASSAIGDDVADLTSLEPAQPEKKKRPPRKKKKKKPKEEEEKKQEPQPANGQRSEAAITRAAERNKNDKGSHVALKQEKSANGTGQKKMLPLETVVEHKKDVKSAAAAAAAAAAAFDEPKQAPASAAPIVSAPPTPAQAVAKPQPKLRVSAPAWETVNKSTSKHLVAQACKADTIPTAPIPVGGNGWKVQSSSRAAPPPRRAVANAPVPGSWARQREYTEAPAVVRHRAAPQADWTKHSMPKSPPKNSIQSSALSSQDNFPSLSSARAKKSNQGSAPKGAWGKKR